MQPTTVATSAGEGIPEIPEPVREWGAGGDPENEGSRKVDEEGERGRTDRKRKKSGRASEKDGGVWR